MKEKFSFLKNNKIFILGIILLFYKSLLMHFTLKIPVIFSNLIGTLLVAVVLMYPCFYRNTKKKLWYLNIMYLLISMVIFGNYTYYGFSSNLVSAYQIDNLVNFNDIKTGFFNLISARTVILYFWDNILLFVVSCVLSFNKHKFMEPVKDWHRQILLWVFLVLNVLWAEFYLDDKYTTFIYNRNMMVQRTSIYYYHIEDTKDFLYHLFFKDKLDYERINKTYDEMSDNKKVNSDMTGIAKGKNVIILQMESVPDYLIGMKINGKEILPNLTEFYKDNIWFTDMYNQGVGTTADAEHSLATGLYPLENGRVFQKFYSNEWNDMYSLLKEEGYFSAVMHPNVNTYWNRFNVYNKGYKIDRYYDINDFESNGDMAGEFFSDEQFYLQAIDKLKEIDGNYIATLIGISTHTPWDLEDIKGHNEKISIDVSGYESWELPSFLRACNFEDYAFGEFVQKLKDEGMWDDTVLIVYGDHGPGLKDTEKLRKLFEENNREYNDNLEKLFNVHIPYAMRIPGCKAEKIDRTVSKIDVKPTILNILGIQDNFSIGEDLFTDKDYAFIKNIGIITSKYYYLNGICYDRKTNSEISTTDYINSLIKKMDDDIYLSDAIINNNIISYIYEYNK